MVQCNVIIVKAIEVLLGAISDCGVSSGDGWFYTKAVIWAEQIEVGAVVLGIIILLNYCPTWIKKSKCEFEVLGVNFESRPGIYLTFIEISS